VCSDFNVCPDWRFGGYARLFECSACCKTSLTEGLATLQGAQRPAISAWQSELLAGAFLSHNYADRKENWYRITKVKQQHCAGGKAALDYEGLNIASCLNSHDVPSGFGLTEVLCVCVCVCVLLCHVLVNT